MQTEYPMIVSKQPPARSRSRRGKNETPPEIAIPRRSARLGAELHVAKRATGVRLVVPPFVGTVHQSELVSIRASIYEARPDAREDVASPPPASSPPLRLASGIFPRDENFDRLSVRSEIPDKGLPSDRVARGEDERHRRCSLFPRVPSGF